MPKRTAPDEKAEIDALIVKLCREEKLLECKIAEKKNEIVDALRRQSELAQLARAVKKSANKPPRHRRPRNKDASLDADADWLPTATAAYNAAKKLDLRVRGLCTNIKNSLACASRDADGACSETTPLINYRPSGRATGHKFDLKVIALAAAVERGDASSVVDVDKITSWKPTKICLPCRRQGRVNNKKTREKNDKVLHAWRETQVGQRCPGKYCNHMLFDEENIGCLEWDHGTNKNLKRPGTSGPGSQSGFPDLKSRIKETLLCVALCSICNCVDDILNSRAHWNAEAKAGRARDTYGAKKQYEYRQEALAYVNKNFKLGKPCSFGCGLVCGVDTPPEGFALCHTAETEHLKARTTRRAKDCGVAGLCNTATCLKTMIPKLDREAEITVLGCHNCHKVCDTNKRPWGALPDVPGAGWA